MLALRLRWVLVRESCNKPFERRGSFIQFVYVHPSSSRAYPLETGADAKTGCVYCSECDNFIYDPAVKNAFVSTTLNAEEKHTRFQGLASGPRNFSVINAKKFLTNAVSRSNHGYPVQKIPLRLREQMLYHVRVSHRAIHHQTQCL